MRHIWWLAAMTLTLTSGCQDLGGLEGLAPEDGEEMIEDGDAPNAGWIGGSCLAAEDCRYDQATCLGEGEGYPEGQCSLACDRLCPDQDGDNSVTFCVAGEAGEEGRCASRCDSDLYPGSGCRAGYTCQILARHGEPGTQMGVCAPEPPTGIGGGDVTSTRCRAALEDGDATWADWDYQTRNADGTNLACTVEDPIRIQSPIGGVRYRNMGGSETLSGSCDLALALERLSAVLADYGITEVIHMGTFNCRTIAGTGRLSQHGHGMAIDIWGFVDQDGQDYVVERDWEIDDPTPQGERGRVLYTIAQRLHREQIFNIILTPDYNAAHRNHFHLDLTAGSRFIGSTDPEEHWLGAHRELCPGW